MGESHSTFTKEMAMVDYQVLRSTNWKLPEPNPELEE
jgi:hypothetical protein